MGTGFFINKNGDFITNFHVLRDADRAYIKTKNGGTYNVKSIIAQYEDLDLIVGRADILDKTPLPVPFSSSLPQIGEKIIVIGNPFVLEQSVTDGIVSAIRETKSDGRTIIQISAPISPGSSGSPVVNMKGEVIGVATFQLIVGQNLNFAVACDNNFVETLKEDEIPFSKWSSKQVRKMTFIGKNVQGYKEYRHELTGMVFVLIPEGTFKMGDIDEKPVHEVTLDSFLISKY